MIEHAGLVERDGQLGELHAALARAGTGAGEVVLVGGEAGAGKTALVREFVRLAAGPPAVRWGGCDPLSAPRPFGPLIDAVTAVDPELARHLSAGATRPESLAAALTMIDGTNAGGRAAVFVVEDAHWADDGTLDMLTFLGRRIAAHRALLVVTYRDDEVGSQHPLRARFGELAPVIRTRIHVPPLSLAGVGVLTRGTGHDAPDVHRMTNGNPFFVIEIVKSQADALPDSIREAVLSRAARLDAGPRRALEAASVVPGRVERWLLASILEADVDTDVETCIERGFLRGAAAAVEFSHELARLAILDAVALSRRRELHAAALRVLEQSGSNSARLAYHAAEAGDSRSVLQHSPAAAAEASALGAHREAALHLANALGCAGLTPAERAELGHRYGDELIMLGRYHEAIEAFDGAGAFHAANGDVEAQAWALVKTARPLVLEGRQQESDDRIAQASRLLAGRPPSRAAALLATAESAAHMLARRFDAAEREGQRGMQLARDVGDQPILAEVSIQSGIALAMNGDDRGLTRIRDGIAIASEAGADYLVELGYSQIGSGYGEMRLYDVAVPALREGVAFGAAREFGSAYYVRAWLGRCELELGNWDAAAVIAGDLHRNPRCVGISRFVALLTLAWLRARRGDPDVGVLLDEALEMARAMQHLQRMWPVAACRAEVAWLADGLDREMELVDEAAGLAAALAYPPAIEELAHWQHLADGARRGSVEAARTAFGLSAAGRPDLAAERWHEVGCPYEAAVAQLLAGGRANLRAAYQQFEALSATPMKVRTAAAMRAAGMRVPRGPTSASRANPGALTDRELDVLTLVAGGRTNREIAESLGISVKTAGHHVSSVLTKLGVRSRGEAAIAAVRLGVVEP